MKIDICPKCFRDVPENTLIANLDCPVYRNQTSGTGLIAIERKARNRIIMFLCLYAERNGFSV